MDPATNTAEEKIIACVSPKLDTIIHPSNWEAKKQKLDAALKRVSGDNLANLQRSLTLYAEIRRSFDSITHIIGDMNALSLEQHIESNFQHVIDKVRERV